MIGSDWIRWDKMISDEIKSDWTGSDEIILDKMRLNQMVYDFGSTVITFNQLI